MYCAFMVGQLDSLNASHRADREFPGLRKALPQAEIQRGRLEGDRWVASLWERYAEDLPHRSERGAVPRAARLVGDLQ